MLASLSLSTKEDRVSRIIPFSSQVSDAVVMSIHGDFMSTWSIEGLPFEGLSNEEIYSRMEALNLLVRSVSNGKFAFWVHRVRRLVADGLDLPPEPGFARDLVAKYYDMLGTGGLMATEIYLTMIYRPYPQQSGKVVGRIGLSLEEIQREREEAIDVLNDLDRQVGSSLQAYGPRRLAGYDHGGKRFSKQLEFYAYLINGFWWRIPVKDVPLDRYLATSRVLFGNEFMETRDTYGSTFSAFVDIKDYVDFSEPGILNTMLGLPCEYIETHSFSPMNALDARNALRLQRNRLISSEDSAVSQVRQIDQAIDELSSGNFSLGEYHYNMQVRGSTRDEVKNARSAAIEALQNSHFLGVAVDLVVDAAYAAQLPGNWRARPRTAKLSSRNFTGLCAMHNFTVGKRNGNPWGEAVTILRSPARQPIYFNFHASAPGEDSTGLPDLANTQIIGKSRGGKTVLALFLMANLAKYGTQCVFFDMNRGAEIAIRAMGGKYLALERGKPTGFNPFKLEPTDRSILFWEDLVKVCTRFAGGHHTPKEEAEIAHAVRACARLPKELRSFSAVVQNLPNVDANSVAERLKKWVADSGSLGWALDCSDDELEFEQGRTYGFDYTELLDDPTCRSAVMMYLLYRIEQLLDGRRFAYFMDEYWKALSDPYFEDFAKRKQKTIGKQNGFGVFMTQSPSDTLQSPIAKALIEQTATYIFLPNPTADRDDYVGGFKLNDTEYEIVKNLPDGSRLMLVKQGESVGVATLNLQGFDDELKVLSGTTQGVARLERLRARLGDEPGNWLDAFIKGEQ